jgi:6,7-dimethyl-8-ribityllumazine synthase
MPTSNADLSTLAGRFAIVVARFNLEVTEKLLSGALSALQSNGIAQSDVDVIHVPGAFELPLVAKRQAASGQYAAVICLGAVIKGDTDHYEYVCRAATDGILRAGLVTGVPVIFGVLTCQTEELALDRAGGKAGNKGTEAALAAIEMANLWKTLGWAGPR